jgi:hypothetical protein
MHSRDFIDDAPPLQLSYIVFPPCGLAPVGGGTRKHCLSDLDLHEIDFHGANLSAPVFNGAADMKNQSVGLMRTSMANSTPVRTDFRTRISPAPT